MSDFATEAQLLAVEDEIHRHRSEGGFQGDEYEIALILVAAAGMARIVKLSRERQARATNFLKLLRTEWLRRDYGVMGWLRREDGLRRKGSLDSTRTCLLPSGKAYVSWPLTVSSGTYLRASISIRHVRFEAAKDRL